jgi:ferrous iron transport protein B
MESTGTSPGEDVARAPGEAHATRIVVVGNPNVGKTSLFNRLTGERARIGNYPGITVERREAKLELAPGRSVRVIDVPGAYSLAARSADEQIAVDSSLGLHGEEQPALALLVLDAGQLGRNLYLALQLLEAGVRVVFALNMIDEVAGNPPSPARLARWLNVPCVATNARRGTGVDELKAALARALAEPPPPPLKLDYPERLEQALARIAERLPSEWRGSAARERALALWSLSSLEADDELRAIDATFRRGVLETRAELEDAGVDIDLEIARTRYAFVDAGVPQLFERSDLHPPKPKISERIDRVLLHPVIGFAVFFGVMLLLFQALFSWSDPLIGLVETGVGALQGFAEDALPPGLIRDLIVQGVIGGVGNVVVFLPQILMLFLAIGVLEDSGYMARAAFLMDRVMRSLGLHGRAFVPLLSGYACAIPAIMATRTMERRRDRILTMMVVPLMTCSARLPVYTLVIAALFPPSTVFGWIPVQGLLMVAMYGLSLVAALGVAWALSRSVVRGRRMPLILELPPYRLPSLQVTLRSLGERAGIFLKEAGTVILAMTVLLWVLLTFPRHDETARAEPATKPPAAEQASLGAPAGETPVASEGTPAADAIAASTTHPQIENSYAGRLGKALEPVIAPLGFDWKIGIGLVGAFAAREVFVSTMGLVYGMGDIGDDDSPLRDRMRAETRADGQPAYSPLTGLSLLVFFAIACQCMSTLAVVWRETRSWRWPTFLFGYTAALAWTLSFAVYQGGKLLGFG